MQCESLLSLGSLWAFAVGKLLTAYLKRAGFCLRSEERKFTSNFSIYFASKTRGPLQGFHGLF